VKLRAALTVLALGCCGCQDLPESYPPPVQRPLFDPDRPRYSTMVNMEDPGADRRFVQDIAGQEAGQGDGGWRWTGQRPTVKVRPESNQGLKLFIDFMLPEVTMKDTGPVTLSFYVNGRVLDRARYTEPGVKHFEKPVPADWVTPGQETIVAAEIDKVWVAKQDGARLGFIVVRMGLAR
jgi:hypothetical protein